MTKKSIQKIDIFKDNYKNIAYFIGYSFLLYVICSILLKSNFFDFKNGRYALNADSALLLSIQIPIFILLLIGFPLLFSKKNLIKYSMILDCILFFTIIFLIFLCFDSSCFWLKGILRKFMQFFLSTYTISFSFFIAVFGMFVIFIPNSYFQRIKNETLKNLSLLLLVILIFMPFLIYLVTGLEIIKI